MTPSTVRSIYQTSQFKTPLLYFKSIHFYMANPLKIRGNVVSLIKHDENTFTVAIMPEQGLPRFKAGQFLHLTLDDYGPMGGFWPESRVFSI